LDWVVLRSTDSQDTDGLLSLAQDVGVGAVLLLAGPGGPTYRAFLQDNAEAARPAITALPGQSLDLGGGATMVVLATGETAGAVIIHFGQFVLAIVPAGVAEDPSLPFPRQVTAAVLPHAGDLVDNSSERLKELDPRLVLLSVEGGNREGFPPVEVLEWLQGRTVLRTDKNGWIELVSDGETVTIWTER
jgi:beta-lactamase superfamily II metal-dependent hydrolase